MIFFSSLLDFSSSSFDDNNNEDDSNRNDNEGDDDYNDKNNNDNDWENETLAGEVDVFESFFLDETFAFSTSLVVFFIGFVVARTRELKKLNMNVII